MATAKSYRNAPETTLTGAVSDTATVFAVTSGTGYPTGSDGKFFVITIDPSEPGNPNANEEQILCQSMSSNTVTVAPGGRGYAGTAAVSHNAGAIVQHTYDPVSAQETMDHVTDPTIDDHPQYYNPERHDTPSAHGSDVVDHGQIGGLDDDDHPQYQNTQRHETSGNHDAEAIINDILPAGIVVDYVGAVAPTGWYLLNGDQLDKASYERLDAVLAAASYPWGNTSTSFTLPDARGRFTLAAGSGSGLTARSVGQTGGAESQTLTTDQIPAHTHAIGGVTGSNTVAHTHTFSGTTASDGAHNHGIGSGDQFTLNRGQVESQRIPDAGSTTNGVYVTYTTVTDTETAHTHTYSGTTSAATDTTHTHTLPAATSANTTTESAVSIMGPYLVLSKIVKL